MYKSEVTLAQSSEAISSSFVDCAITISKRILHVAANQELLAFCDSFFIGSIPHPIQSIYVFQALCDRGQTHAKITWGLACLIDHYRMDYINLGAFAISKISSATHLKVVVSKTPPS